MNQFARASRKDSERDDRSVLMDRASRLMQKPGHLVATPHSAELWAARRVPNSNSILSAAFGPRRISPIISDPGGKSFSNIGSPEALMFARTDCRKCHLKSSSTARSGQFKIFYPDICRQFPSHQHQNGQSYGCPKTVRCCN